jgi:hypothetical protein
MLLNPLGERGRKKLAQLSGRLTMPHIESQEAHVVFDVDLECPLSHRVFILKSPADSPSRHDKGMHWQRLKHR